MTDDAPYPDYCFNTERPVFSRVETYAELVHDRIRITKVLNETTLACSEIEFTIAEAERFLVWLRGAIAATEH